MTVPTDPPTAYAPLVELDRARLLDLLATLTPADWQRTTPCPGWRVLDLAVHLVGDDVHTLASQRDDHHGTVPPDGIDERGFVHWLDDLQREWVRAGRRLSPRLVVDLLAWLGDQVVATMAAQDPTARTAHVSWADAEPVPVWLDHARELAERWIHRQQLLEALGRSSDLRGDLAAPVLDALRWAYPYRLRPVLRAAGTHVHIDVTGPELTARWVLVADANGGWTFASPDESRSPAATLTLSTDDAWRLLTSNLPSARRERLAASGEPRLVDVLLATRAIIGDPAAEPAAASRPASA